MRQRPLAALGWFTCVSMFLLSLEAAAPLIQIDNPSPAADAAFGTGLAGIGDVNGDGTPDFVSGAPGANKAFVISGDDRSLIRTHTDPDGATDLNFGFAVAGTGDITGDGVDDIAVGAPGPLGPIVPLPCDPSLGGVCPPAALGPRVSLQRRDRRIDSKDCPGDGVLPQVRVQPRRSRRRHWRWRARSRSRQPGAAAFLGTGVCVLGSHGHAVVDDAGARS